MPAEEKKANNPWDIKVEFVSGGLCPSAPCEPGNYLGTVLGVFPASSDKGEKKQILVVELTKLR